MSWLDVPALLTAAVWLVLVLAHGRFWTTAVRLPQRPPPARWPSVAIVVPARDEAALLPQTLPPLLAQEYPGPLRVVLADDGSTDGTGELARALGAGARVPLTVVDVPDRPVGWAGKVWAQEQALARTADAEWVLLTDADIAHPPDAVAALVSAAVADDRDLVSLMVRLRTETVWERLVVPAFVYFFAQLYPFRWVAAGRVAAAAGGCVLVRRAVLEAAGGVAAVRGAVIDDVALAGAVHRAGGRLWLGLATQVRSVRPYPRLADLWSMVARSAYTQLRHSPALLAGTVAGLLLVYVAPVACCLAGLATGAPVAAVAGGLAWSLMTASYLPQVRHHRQPAALALTLPLVAVLYLLMTLDSARRSRAGRGATWKGRAAVG
ncbi:glycosyltransferase [Modestobacter sp. NPDC049651]|uniref:glycosyltransferase n=1 Tax=unclassified Modestobacter TaxID=2643866 RepID=UPI0033DD6D86